MSMSPPSATESSFLRSALTVDNPDLPLEEIPDWLQSITDRIPFRAERIPFRDLDQWDFEPETGDLSHNSGRFFRIEGVRVRTNWGPVTGWDQPIINQPEVGILGMITRMRNGVRHFLVQVKMEPGNIIPAQLAPSVQATKSNFTRAHKGKLPPLLDYFLDPSRARLLVDQLQTEQGARFLRKRNRNMIVEVDDDVAAPDNYRWVTLGQMKELLKANDLVNMDARSVLSCIPFVSDGSEGDASLLSGMSDFGRDLYRSMQETTAAVNSVGALETWFDSLKERCHLEATYLSLNRLEHWVRTEDEIRHETGEFMSVIAVNVALEGREVTRWTQPLVAHPHIGVIGYLAKKFDGVLHFLVHAHSEPGVLDRLDMAPTVICSDPDRNRKRPGSVPYLERLLEASAGEIRFDVVHSEEGGRFYQVRNRYLVVEVPEDEPVEVPGEYAWMTLRQIIDFTRHQHYFNVEGRSLLACMSFL